jgi:rSAM/selenodomain-associated transferase 2
MGILAMMLQLRGHHPKRLLLYAANPLVLLTTTGHAHAHAFFTPVLFAALWMLLSGKTISGFAALGMTGVNPCLSPAVWPYFFSRSNWKPGLLALLMLATFATFNWIGFELFPWGPAADIGKSPVDGLMGVLRAVFGDWAGSTAAVLLCGCLAVIYLAEPDPLRSVYLSIGALVLLAGSLEAWHLVLMAPFLCFYPSPAWIALQMVFFLWSPAVFGNPQEVTDDWAKWFVPLLFLGLLLRGLIRNRYPFAEPRFKPPTSIAVVIPTLNESETLGNCLDILQDQDPVSEIIVADGGSGDETCLIAVQKGATVIQAPRGRGMQIAAGIEAAAADVLLILHSDCILSNDATGRIMKQLKSRPEAPGGSLGMDFEIRRLKMRFISFLNNMRARFSGIAFGDQAQFMRRDALPLIGGFPAMALMEDVELSMRLKSIGQTLFLPGGVTVSARRWMKTAFGANLLLVLRLCFRYLVQRRWREGNMPAEYYSRAYYGEEKWPRQPVKPG